MAAPSITSDELNFLVFRYLQESGFMHSAFALGYEAGINVSPIDGNLIPPGALVKFVQKGLQYIELEAHLSNNAVDEYDDLSLLQPLDLITKDVHELRQIIKEKKENLQKLWGKDEQKCKEPNQENEHGHGYETEKEILEREKGKQKGKDRIEKEKDQEKERETDKQQEQHIEKESIRDHEEKIKCKSEENGASGVHPLTQL